MIPGGGMIHGAQSSDARLETAMGVSVMDHRS
jgi:hypothetical protein